MDIGRVEYISGFIVSFLILIMGVELLKESIFKIFNDSNYSDKNNISLIIMLVMSIFIKIYMYIYNKNIGRKINSETLIAAAKDSISDCVATSFVLINAMFSKYLTFNLDAICSIIVSIFIIFTGIETCKKTISLLIGISSDTNLKEKIIEIAMNEEKILGIHDLMIHDYGANNIIVTFHAEFPCDEDFKLIHEIADKIERKIKNDLGCMCTIHMDPIDLNNEMINDISSKILEDLKKYIGESVTIHDFKITNENNVIFDIVLPYDLNLNDDEIYRKCNQIVKKINNKYTSVVQIDRK